MKAIPDTFRWVYDLGVKDAGHYYESMDMWPRQDHGIQEELGQSEAGTKQFLATSGVLPDNVVLAYAIWVLGYLTAGTNLHYP